MNIQQCCAFTGHRPSHFSFAYDENDTACIALKQSMREHIIMLIGKGVKTYLSGMALGVDTWGAELVLKLKPQYPQMQLIAVLPCETQAIRWSAAQRERYYNILAACDKEVFVSRQYTSDCMLKRNRYLVNHAAYLLAAYDGGDKGGTAYTVNYAKQKGREVMIIPVSGNKKQIDFEELL